MAATQPPVGRAKQQTPQELWTKLNRQWLIGSPQINQTWFANVETRRQILNHKAILPSCRIGLSPVPLQPVKVQELNSQELDSQDGYPTRAFNLFSSAIASNSYPAKRPLLLIAEPDPLDFLASFWAALLSGWNIALANPNWGTQEWQSALQILSPDLVWASNSLSNAAPNQALSNAIADPNAPTPDENLSPKQASSPFPSILIPTGGTSGQLKFAHHTWQTLLTATASFCHTFPTPVNTYCVLPLHHVSGLMQILRAWYSHGQVIITTFKLLETTAPAIDDPHNWYISLVPTQLTRLLQANKGTWLSQFQAVFIGGAPTWPALLNQATKQNIPICLSYGTTETAAMVAALSPKDFLTDSAAQNTSGYSLSHAKIEIQADGKPLPPNAIGQIVIHAASIALGYYAQSPSFAPQTFHTDDLGYLTPSGQLHITGRASSKIISGGENIFPAEVEAALRSTGQLKDVHVFGQLDPQWGEIVTAAFVPAHSQVTVSSIQAAIARDTAQFSPEDTPPTQLSRYKYPKKWISLSVIPRSAQGKLLKSELMAQIATTQPIASNPLAADFDDDSPGQCKHAESKP